MYIYRNLPLSLVWRFGWKNFAIFIGWGSLIYYINHNVTPIYLPFELIGTVGVAVTIFLSFKNSQSYDRQWEARKIWGELASASKILTNQLSIYISSTDKDLHSNSVKKIVYRQIAFLNALRLQLRNKFPHSREYKGAISVYYYGEANEKNWTEEVGKFLEESEFAKLKQKTNFALNVLNFQYIDFLWLKNKNLIDEIKQIELNKTIDKCIEAQGKCERIKSTPFPRQYGFFSKAFVWIFILMLPLSLIDINLKKIDYFVVFVGLNTLISWIFITLELVGDYSEDPFENFASDVPISSICRNLEIDLKSMIGNTDIPGKIKDENGYLM